MEDILKYWPAFTSFISIIGGGFITWSTAKTKMEGLLTSHQKLESRVDTLEKNREADRVVLADRLARMEVKLESIHIKLESK